MFLEPPPPQKKTQKKPDTFPMPNNAEQNVLCLIGSLKQPFFKRFKNFLNVITTWWQGEAPYSIKVFTKCLTE